MPQEAHSPVLHITNERARKHFDQVLQRTTFADVQDLIKNIVSVHPNLVSADEHMKMLHGLATDQDSQSIAAAINFLKAYRKLRFREHDSLGKTGKILYKVDAAIAFLHQQLDSVKSKRTRNTEKREPRKEANGKAERVLGLLRQHFWFFDFPQINLDEDPNLNLLITQVTQTVKSYGQSGDKESVSKALTEIFDQAKARIESKQSQTETWSSVHFKSDSALDDLPHFTGDIESAKMHMRSFQQGVELGFAIKNFPIGNTRIQFQQPEIHVVYNAPRNVGLQYLGTINRVVIDVRRLEQISAFENGPLRKFFGTRGDVLHVATLEHFMILQGVEEGSHAAFLQAHPDAVVHAVGADPGKLAEYDASDIEYYALLAQLEVAERKRMPKQTIEHIRLRIANAQKVRGSTHGV